MEKEDWDELKKDIKRIKQILENHEQLSSSTKWLTSKGASAFLNIKVRTIYSYISKGILHPKKIGDILLIERAELESL
jgi:hypothetical protein